MSYTIEVSNATGNNYNLPMYLKDSKGNTYLQDFKIPAYALNHKLSFHSEEEFNKWKQQHNCYLDGKDAVIKIGKTSGHSLEKQNKAIEKDEDKKIKEDHKKIDDVDKEVKIETEVSKVKK